MALGDRATPGPSIPRTSSNLSFLSCALRALVRRPWVVPPAQIWRTSSRPSWAPWALWSFVRKPRFVPLALRRWPRRANGVLRCVSVVNGVRRCFSVVDRVPRCFSNGVRTKCSVNGVLRWFSIINGVCRCFCAVNRVLGCFSEGVRRCFSTVDGVLRRFSVINEVPGCSGAVKGVMGVLRRFRVINGVPRRCSVVNGVLRYSGVAGKEVLPRFRVVNGAPRHFSAANGVPRCSSIAKGVLRALGRFKVDGVPRRFSTVNGVLSRVQGETIITVRHPKGPVEVLIDTGGWRPRMRGLEGWLSRAIHEVEQVDIVDMVGCRTFSIAGRAGIGVGRIVSGGTRYCRENERGQGLPVVLGDVWLSSSRSQRGWFLVVVIYNAVGKRGSSGFLQLNDAPVKAAN